MVLGIVEFVLIFLKGNSKNFRYDADLLSKHKNDPRSLVDRGIGLGKKRKLICCEAGSCSY